MTKSASILILILTFCFGLSFAQGDFLESGQDGFQIAGQYTKTDNGNEVSGTASYSLNGVIDLGMSIGKMTYDNSGDILNGSFYGPLFAIHIRKKPTNQLPVSLSFIFNNR